jgi:hypothetical protein
MFNNPETAGCLIAPAVEVELPAGYEVVRGFCMLGENVTATKERVVRGTTGQSMSDLHLLGVETSQSGLSDSLAVQSVVARFSATLR